MDKEAPKPQDNSDDEPQDSLEELDDEQLKAFESIMSQIEGGETNDSDDPPEEEALASTSNMEDEAFTAELETVVKEAESAKDASIDSEIDDEGLDAEQMKAFESIMSQMDDDESEKADPADSSPKSDEVADSSEKVVPDELEIVEIEENKENVPQDQQEDAAASPSEETAGESSDTSVDDISGDIEDLLSSIASEDEEEEEEPEESDAIVLTQVDDNEPDSPATADVENVAEKKAGGLKTELPDEEKRSVGMEVPVAPLPENGAGTDSPAEPKEMLQEAKKIPSVSSKRKSGVAVALSMGLLVVILVAGVLYWQWPILEQVKPSEPLAEIQHPEEEKPAPKVLVQEELAIKNDKLDDIRRLDELIQFIATVRNEVSEKKQEIHALRDYYQTGIKEETKELVDLFQTSQLKKKAIKKVPDDSRVQLGLQAIQRRDATIKRLKKPSTRLFVISEELLFLSRKAKVLMLMAGETSDIDVDSFIEKTTEICNRYRDDTDSLTIDEGAVTEVELTTIWREVVRQTEKKQIAQRRRKTSVPDNNEAIWKEICQGDYSRKDMLTALSAGAARCLVKWEGKDLYLNKLTSLSPEAAGHLSKWEGEWLGLNGLTDLSAPTATQLSKWKGRVLSLNGLTRLSPKIVDILSSWQGDQIELINVQHMAHWDNPKTRLFLSEEFQQHFAKRE